jgi:hypothetical protein
MKLLDTKDIASNGPLPRSDAVDEDGSRMKKGSKMVMTYRELTPNCEALLREGVPASTN